MGKSNTTHKLAAVLTAGMMVGESASASANGVDFTTVEGSMVHSAAGLPSMIETVAYVSGIGLGVAGIFKLKNHVDNPAQHPMKDGLVRLGAGGGLLALPYLTQAMASTINNGGTNVGVTEGVFNPPQFTAGG